MKHILIFCLCFLCLCCGDEQNDCDNTSLSYVESISGIIEMSCNNGDCHVGPNGGWAVLPDFSTYNNVLSYLESGVFNERINSQDSTLSMPPKFREDRQISETDLRLLNDWICNGFPEN